MPAKKKEPSKEENGLTSTDIDAQEANNKRSSFPVIGIGASAGGLAAFEAFFSGMPSDSDTGMAFCLCSTWHLTIKAF